MELDDTLYRLLFDANPRPMWVFDRETLRILLVNDAAVRFYGWSREELCAMTLRDLRPPSEHEAFDAVYAAPKDQPRYARVARHWKKSGDVIDVDLEIKAFAWRGRDVSIANITEVTGLAEAERRFRLMVEHSTDAISLTRADGITEYVSPGGERILDLPVDQLVGQNCTPLVHPDDLAAYVLPPPGETRHHVARVRHRDGSWRWIESSTTNLFHDPAIRALVANYRDITERKAAELAMLETQRRMQYLMSATSAITYSARIGLTNGVTFISANVTGALGYEPQDFYDDPTFWFDHIHPDDRAAVQAASHTVRAQGVDALEYRFRHRDGTYRWMRDVARVMRDADGKSVEIVGYWVDHSEHKRAEIQLRRSEANFRTLIERSPSAIFVKRDDKYVYVNPAAVALCGFTRAEEMIGMDALELVHPDDREPIRLHAATEARMVRRDRSVFVIEIERILLDFDGEPSTVIVGRDVTESRELVARMALADRMLTVGTLAAGVAHEINNPLSYVAANLTILERELPVAGSRADMHDLVADARDGVARVSAIVRELRALARPDDDTRGPVDVSAVLATAIKMAHNEIRHRARVVEVFDPETPPVNAHASRLGQVFLNLLINAAQAIPDGRADEHEIRVRARPVGGRVRVDIEDTGVGIPATNLRRIFDPFFTTKAPGVGVGLGLAISHQIVRAMDGEITVESRPGEGSTFTVMLPIAHANGAHAPERPAPRPTCGQRILVIDDEAAVGRALAALLAPDHDVVPVIRAQDALERLARGERYDLILCDLMMPEISGMELYERIAPELRQRIIFITGGAFTPAAQQFLAGLARPHLEKPFDEAKLRDAIERSAV